MHSNSVNVMLCLHQTCTAKAVQRAIELASILLKPTPNLVADEVTTLRALSPNLTAVAEQVTCTSNARHTCQHDADADFTCIS